MRLYRATYSGWSDGYSGHSQTFCRWFAFKKDAAAWLRDAGARGLVRDDTAYGPTISQMAVPTKREALAAYLTRMEGKT